MNYIELLLLLSIIILYYSTSLELLAKMIELGDGLPGKQILSIVHILVSIDVGPQ